MKRHHPDRKVYARRLCPQGVGHPGETAGTGSVDLVVPPSNPMPA